MWAPIFLTLCLLAVGTATDTSTFPIHVLWQDSTYLNYIDGAVGSPPQNQNITLDFFTTDSYLVDVDAKITCTNNQPTLFDYMKSSSFQIIKNYTTSYDNKVLVQDSFTLAGAPSSKTLKFNITNSYPDDWNCSPYGGSIGLGVEPKRKDTVISQVLSDFSKKIVTISPDKKTTVDPKIPQLTLTLGDTNEEVCGKQWVEVSCYATYEFTYPACTFRVDGFSFDAYTKKTYSFAQAALSLQQYTYLPSTVYDKVVRILNYDETIGGVSCDGSHPDLSIIINDIKFTLPGNYYVGESIGNGYCEFLMLNGVASQLADDLFVLPIGIFSQNCQQLDFSKGKMSLASTQ